MVFIYLQWENVQKANLVLTTTPGQQDKIARIKWYRQNSFVSFPLTYGKLCVSIKYGWQSTYRYAQDSRFVDAKADLQT